MVQDYIYPHYWLTRYEYLTKALLIHKRQTKWITTKKTLRKVLSIEFYYF